MSSRLQGALLVLAAALCWSTGGILVRVIDADGWTVIFWRSAFLVLAIGLYLVATHGRNALGVARAVGWAGLASGALLSGTFVLYILALRHTTVANTVVLMSASPLVAAFLGRLFLGEAVGSRTLVTTLVALGGIAVMFADGLGSGGALGNAFALGVAACFGTNIAVVRAWSRVDMVPAMAVGGLLALAVAWPFASPAATSAADLAALAFMGFFQLGVGLFLFVRGVRHVTAAEAGLLTLTETLAAPLWVWVGIGEAPTPAALAGAGMILAALVGHAALGGRRTKAPASIAWPFPTGAPPSEDSAPWGTAPAPSKGQGPLAPAPPAPSGPAASAR